jgi:adenine phosphoribosyltransferase
LEFETAWERAGRFEGHRIIVLRVLRRKFGVLPNDVLRRVETLPGEQYMPLGLALLDFTHLSDLVAWLDALPPAAPREADEVDDWEDDVLDEVQQTGEQPTTAQTSAPPHYLKLIDTSTPGRYDVTPLFADHATFTALVTDLAAPFSSSQIAYVAGIDALGFILGTAVALELGVGFIPIRKGGKLPGAKHTATFVDYSGQEKMLELRAAVVQPGTRVLLVDEWIETGAQVRTAIGLLEAQGAQIIGVAAIAMDDNAATRALRTQYRCYALIANL